MGLLLALLLLGCPDPPAADFDEDGTIDALDCAPTDPSVFPGANDPIDSIDQDCDGFDGRNPDGDPVAENDDPPDCNEADASIYPGAEDTVGDGVDNDCDGLDGVDSDDDNVASIASGGTDCDDDDPDIHPFATEFPDDGVDQDCDGEELQCDQDNDGALGEQCGGADCDDHDANVYPSAEERCNGLDDNCDGDLTAQEADVDSDGVAACEGDCDDLDASVFPAAPEGCDGLDTDCDGLPSVDEADLDDDGVAACEGDCDDEDPDIAPGLPEACDRDDSDCDGLIPDDELDGDGDGQAPCEGDCDDIDPTVFLGAPEVLYDGEDQDCDGADLDDVDGDGVPGPSDGGQDCDDQDPSVFPGAPDFPFDGVIPDCDGFDGIDNDGDGSPGGSVPPGSPLADALDCDDDDWSMNHLDEDGDGLTTCAGDCDDDSDVTHALDTDGDGVTTCDAVPDCDDGDATIGPGFPELCDLLDNDCDGALPADEADGDSDGDPLCSDCDDSLAAFDTLDLDGDGVTTCGPDGLPDIEPNPSDGDCDDANPDRRPGLSDAPDDGLDANCDGVPGVDADQDGFAAFISDCDDSDATLNQADEDGDGVTSCDGDCDDFDAGAFPGNAEDSCDGYDSDCVLDPLEVDDDGDGAMDCGPVCDYGNPALECTRDCDDGDAALNLDDVDNDGFTTCGEDCDDGEALTYPDAPEQCDLADNNCDGSIDEGVDTDGDGDGWFPCQGDCNDLNGTVYPAAPELCDAVDNDCDGTVPADEVDDDADLLRVCDGDCDDANLLVSPEAAELLDGIDNDCDGVVDDEAVTCSVEVPTDFTSIDAAVAASSNGDVVCVLPGTHVDTVYFNGRQVDLVGVAGRLLTTIDAQQQNTVVRILNTHGPDTKLRGFTLTGGSSSQGAGLRIRVGDPTITQLRIQGNVAHTQGGGVYINTPAVTLTDVEIAYNQADLGGGVYIEYTSGSPPASIVLDDVLIEWNQADSKGGGVYATGADLNAVLTESRIEDNTAWTQNGGGVALTSASLEAWDTAIVGNVADQAGGGLWLSGASAQVWATGLELSGNYASDGGGLHCGLTSQTVVLEDSQVAYNILPVQAGINRGGGIHCACTLDLDRVLLDGNSGESGSAMYADSDCVATMSNLVALGEDGTTLFRVDGGSDVTLTHSHVQSDNTALIGFGYASLSISHTSLLSDARSVLVDSAAAPPVIDHSNAWGNAFPYSNMSDPTGTDGNTSVDPQLVDPANGDWHLSPTSPLIDAGDPSTTDPDGSPADIGPFGGPNADLWDLDGDGFPSWWQPRPYDPAIDVFAGLDCDDQDPTITPLDGC